MMTIALLCLMLGIALALNFVQNNYHVILYTALFSFCAASIYFISAAPDLALAEAAIGCAFIPLVYTIAIRRQNTFTVVFFSQEDSSAYCPPELLIEFMGIAEGFCSQKGLKLRVKTHPEALANTSRGIFTLGNTDLVASYVSSENRLHLWGNEANKLLPELAEALGKHEAMYYEVMGGEWVDE